MSSTYIPLTRARMIAPTIEYLHRAGASVEDVLAAAHVPAWVASESDALVPAQSSTRVRGAAARATGMPNLGLTVGEGVAVESTGVLGAMIRNGSTLGAALEAMVRYAPLLSSRGRMQLRMRGEHVELSRALTPALDPSDFDSQQTDQFILGLMLAFVRLAAGPACRPTEAHFQTDEMPALRDAESLAGVRVAFRRPATMITVPRALLTAPLPRSRTVPPDPAVEEWTCSAPAGDFVGSMRQAIETLSSTGYPDIRTTADFVGMSVRTLQRRLAKAGASHHMLVAQTRFATAAAVLERTDAKVLDLALDLGYSDHGNFTRAFRRWAGCAPRQYRLKHAELRGSAKSVPAGHMAGNDDKNCIRRPP